MESFKKPKRKKPSLGDRFEFIGDAVAPGNRAALRSAMFAVRDNASGAERTLKLWRKTGSDVDEDLRQLWLHEMRQVQRVMAYAGARDVIVDVLEFVEDADEFGIVLESVGQPLSEKRKRITRQHWLRNLGSLRSRTLLWRNIKRVARAVGIIHAQGLVHGRITSEVIMTEGAEEPDFELGGFEWSLWLSADQADRSYAKIGTAVAAARAEKYSFEGDWHSLGLVLAECLESVVKANGDVVPAGSGDPSVVLNFSERALLKRLVAPARMDQLDADAIARAIDDVVSTIARSVSDRAGAFVMTFVPQAKLADAVYDVTDGQIAVDEYLRQLDWVRADLDGGATLLVPRAFEPSSSKLTVVTDAMIYKVRAFLDEGNAVWDIAVCQSVSPRTGNFSLGDTKDHSILQPIAIAGNLREAQELRGRFGPDALDWSAFADPQPDVAAGESDLVRAALLLVQVVEAVVKALDFYPVDILDTGRLDGQRFASLRAQPNNDRDRFARRVGLSESGAALKRLFEEEHRDADAKWRLTQTASLGAARHDDVVASFVDVVETRGLRAYQFEIDDDLPLEGPFYLRPQRDAGTEQVISRRLRNIKALDTRIDLAEMLADPWRVRRSSREGLSDYDRNDERFLDLDDSKKVAIEGIWSVLPAFFIVGPPGVGKTRLATEVVRRAFANDRSTRMLISAHGHDALDNLQEKLREMLVREGLQDVMMVRSRTPDQRSTSDEEVHRTALGYLDSLSRSELARRSPAPIRDRILSLRQAAEVLEDEKDIVDWEQRSGVGAVLHLVLDAANIVISTANSPDVEDFVETGEQFDWVVIEEAAKATGPELVGPLMASGRRLLIGDHHQLPPFDADRLVKILSDHALVTEALKLSEQFVAPLARDGELEELNAVAADAVALRNLASMALRLLEPFRTFVEDDERKQRENPAHRVIAATLTEQRRMDPAIARIVSNTFYKGTLDTHEKRRQAAESEDPPIVQLGGLPKSPVVVVNFPHVSSTGQERAVERSRPRWHNPSEVGAVVDILHHLRCRDQRTRPTLAILSPYAAQVEKLHDRIASLRRSSLRHLNDFASVRSNGEFAGTVDSFQGSEADVVILSLVRNNPRTGSSALGFLRDSRRMNVSLSRAKSQLIIVGSLTFLREAVRGTNPDGESDDLSFLTRMLDAIDELTLEERNGQPLARIVDPTTLRQRS